MKNWHGLVGIGAGVGALYLGYRWYQNKVAMALGVGAGPPRGQINGLLPGPAGSGQSTMPTPGPGALTAVTGFLAPGLTLLGRPDVAARRLAGSQAAQEVGNVAMNAAASGWRSIVAGSAFVAELGDSTATGHAAKVKAQALASQAMNNTQATAAQAQNFVSSTAANVDNAVANTINRFF